jgi:transcription elongation factor Elf1
MSMVEKKQPSIFACPRCGSKRIEMGTMNQGVLFGVTSWKSVCKNCGYQGEPLIFEDEESYQKFLEGLSKDRAQVPITESQQSAQVKADESATEETAGLTPKEKEVVEYAHDVEEESQGVEDHKLRAPVFDETKSWRVEVLVALIISAIWTTVYLSFYAFRFFTSLDLLFMFLYTFFYFAATTLVILVVIIIAEYVYYRRKRIP